MLNAFTIDFVYISTLKDVNINSCFTEMCSGSEACSYVRLIDSVYHSTLGLRVMKNKKKCTPHPPPQVFVPSLTVTLVFYLYLCLTVPPRRGIAYRERVGPTLYTRNPQHHTLNPTPSLPHLKL